MPDRVPARTSRARGPLLPGREDDLAVLDRALEHARAGNAQVVLIEAEPGLGKSALLETFLDRPDVGELLRLRCDRFEADVAFGAVGVLLDGSAPIASEVDAGRQLLARLSDAQSSSEPQSAGAGVTVLAIDDAQWMDRSSAQAIRFALRRLRADPVLAVIARRPVPAADHGALDADAATAVIRPTALREDSVRELARQLRSWDLSPDAAERLVRRTGGLPLLLVAILRGADGPAQLEVGGNVPATAAAEVAGLMRSATPATHRLVQAIAVLAEPTDVVVLGQVADVEHPFEAVDDGVMAGLIVLTAHRQVDCAHELLREAVYQAIPLGRRQQLHTQAARWATGDRRLAHLSSAADRPDSHLAAELLAAADTARAERRYDLAAAHRLRARSVSGDTTERGDLLLEALLDRVAAQSLSGADELAEPARGLPPSALRNLALGMLARESGRIGEARTLLGDALTRARAGGDAVMTERAGIALAILHVRLNEGLAAVEAIGNADRATDPEVATDALTWKGIGLWHAGDPSAALALLDAARLSRNGQPWEAELLATRGAIRLYSGQLKLALADFDRAIGLVHLWRPSSSESRIYVLRSLARYWSGDWDGAAVDATASRALADGRAEAWSVPAAYAVSADVPIGRGRWSVARESLKVAETALASLASVDNAAAVAEREASLLLSKHDYAQALAVLTPVRTEEQLSLLASFRPYRWVMPAWILAHLGLGRHSDAERSLAEYEEMLDRWPGGPTPARLGWLRGLLAEARGERRVAREHYAAELSDPELSRVPFLHAQVLYDAGRLARSLDQRQDAIDLLRPAQSIFGRLRATPHLRLCAAELRASGQQTMTATPWNLSSREEDIASLVARGYTNKEVGAELFLTAKTVDYHLSHIFAKLGVSSRRQLRNLHPAS